MSAPNLKLNEAQKIGVEHLRFDNGNPRYSGEHLKGDVEIIRYLADTADMTELLQSISANGYIDIEPLVVMRSGASYTVLEGNRRLAALKLLRDPKLVRECGITVPEMSNDLRETLREVTVYPVKNREGARNFIGFKHINGPHRWDSFAKARFAADWYRVERVHGTTLREIARRMGDGHDTIKRMVAGMNVLDQARASGVFDPEDRFPGRQFAFSHLYTALTRPGFRSFLGLAEDWRSSDPEQNPVSKKNLANLKLVTTWLYGSKEDNVRPVVVSQNPHVKQLGDVLAHPKARAILVNTGDLAAAYSEIDTPDLQFERSLVEAHQHTENALRKVTAFDGADETLVQVSSELAKNAALIKTVMTDKRDQLVSEPAHKFKRRRDEC